MHTHLNSGNPRYVNGFQSLQVQNPGYKLLGMDNFMFESESEDSNYGFKENYQPLQTSTTVEDTQGYLQPLVLDADSDNYSEQKC